MLDERAWFKANPDAQVTKTTDRLVLWNYPIGGTALASGHAAAVRAFLQTQALALAREQATTTIAICGHASTSGEAAANASLARSRADNVAKHLADLGFRHLEVTGSGSSQPADTAGTGQALARNRRVEVTLYAGSLPSAARVPIPYRENAPPSVRSGGVAWSFEDSIKWEFPRETTTYTETVVTAIAKFKVTLISGDPAVAAAFSIERGRPSAEFTKVISQHISGRLAFEKGEKGLVARMGTLAEVWGFPVEEGFQLGNFPQIAYIKVTLKEIDLGEVKFATFSVAGKIELQLLAEIGPSKSLLFRLGVGAEGVAVAAEAAWAVLGVVAITSVIIGGTIYAADAAKKRFALLVEDMNERDGAAAAVAHEALGQTAEDLVLLRQHRAEVKLAGGARSEKAFDSGLDSVGRYLRSLGDGHDAKVKAWATTFGASPNSPGFDALRKKVLTVLHPLEDDAPALDTLLPSL